MNLKNLARIAGQKESRTFTKEENFAKYSEHSLGDLCVSHRFFHPPP